MFELLQRHRKRHWQNRDFLLLRSWNALSQLGSRARLVAFFGSSNLFWPYSMDRMLGALLSRHAPDTVVLNLGSYGFGDSRHVVESTISLIESFRSIPIRQLVYEVTPNEMPPLEKQALPSQLREAGGAPLVLGYEVAAPVIERLMAARLPLLEHLERLAHVSRAASAPFPVCLLDYESNLREWPPTLSHFARALPRDEEERFRAAAARAIELVREGLMEEAVTHLDRCDAIDPDVALTLYLRAKTLDGIDNAAAADAYRRARDRDLVRGRLSRDRLIPQLREWCARFGFSFVSVPAVIRRLSPGGLHGFDVFVDDVHYRPHVHLAIAEALCASIADDDSCERLSAADAERLVRALDAQEAFTLLQNALNLVMVPPSPYNDERVRAGLRYLDQAETLGVDAAVLREYRLKFALLAGLSADAERLFEEQAFARLDPLAFALRPAARRPSASANQRTHLVIEEVSTRLADLLARRFHVYLSPGQEDEELTTLGLDSLGIAELMLEVEKTFDVPSSELELFDRHLSLAALRERIVTRLVEPPARRLAHEKSLARQLATGSRTVRSLDEARIVPAAVQESAVDSWSNATISEVLERNFRERPAAAAVTVLPSGSASIGRTLTLTWSDLDRVSSAAAARMQDAGLRSGEVVHLLTGHGLTTVAAAVGAFRIGAIPSIVHEPSAKTSADAFIRSFGGMLRRTGARLVVTAEAAADVAGAVIDRTCSPSDAPARLVLSDRTLAAAARDQLQHLPAPPRDADSVALLQHSSGTTGARKGVRLTHRAILRQVHHYARAIDLRRDDSIVSWLPLYHDMGLIACFVLPLLTGTPVTLMSPFDWIAAPHLLLQMLAAQRGTLAWLPNFAFHVLVERVRPEHLEGVSLTSVRSLVNCSEPIQYDAWQRFYDRFSFFGLSRFAYGTCYAMAETTFAVAHGGTREPVFVDLVDAERLRRDAVADPIDASSPDANVTAVPSSGRIVEGCQVRIVSADGRPLEERRVGQIEVVSDALAAGYENNPEATARAFRDGWYRTGDLGYAADDRLFVLGRHDDVIVVAGVNVFPLDIEQIASQQPGVRAGRVVAFGLRDEQRGTQRVVVLCEAADDRPTSVQAQMICGAVQKAIVEILQIGGDVFLVPRNTVLKTTSGKPARRAMQERFESGDLQIVGP